MKKEVFKDIKGYEGLYQISTHGRVKSLPSGKSPNKMKERFLSVKRKDKAVVKLGLYDGFNRKMHVVARLVLSHFEGFQPKGMVACHKDSDKNNNLLSNLFWGLPGKAVEITMEKKGWKRGSEKDEHPLTKAKVIKIKKLIKKGVRSQDIADQFGVSYPVINSIKKGRTWNDV